MDEESNWRCGVSLGGSLSTGDRKKNHEKRDRVCACLLYVCMHVWVNRFMGSSAFSSLVVRVVSICCPDNHKFFLSSTTACSSVFLGMHRWRVYMSAFCCFSLSILWQGLVYFAAPLVKKQWLLEGVSRHSFNKWAYLEWAMGPGPLRQMWLKHFNSPPPPPRTYVDTCEHTCSNIHTISKILTDVGRLQNPGLCSMSTLFFFYSANAG